MKLRLIFDFDGTIANTLDLIIEIANHLLQKYGFKETRPDKTELDKKTLRGQSIKSILKKLNVPLIKLPSLAKAITEDLSLYIGKLKPVPGIPQVLNFLKINNYSLNLITSNTKNNIEIFLKNNDLEIFDIIYSDSSIFGKSRIINRFLTMHNINPTDAIYIGDETRDIEAAKKSKLKIIAVTWGFNDEQILKKYAPDFLAKYPQDLIKIIQSL